MRNYIRLETIYPKKLLFGDYTLVHDVKPNDLTPEIMDFYGLNLSNDYEFPSVSLYKLNERLCVMDSGILVEHTNKFFMDNASGKILTFGLGLGYIIFPLLEDDSVTSITIVEKNIEIYNKILKYYERVLSCKNLVFIIYSGTDIEYKFKLFLSISQKLA
jgi:hypothetical protein